MPSLLPENISAFYETIARLLERYHRPALCVSWGKDSHVLFALLRGRGWPVVMFRPAHVTARQWKFARQMIEHYDLRPHFVPPEAIALRRLGEALHVVTSYRVGEGNSVMWEQAIVPDGDGGRRSEVGGQEEVSDLGPPTSDFRPPTSAPRPPPSAPPLCAVDDIFDQPVGRLYARWDLLLSAQKDGDPDLAGGKLARPLDLLHNPGGPDIAFPLRTWTDDDVWAYHEQRKLPFHEERYSLPDDEISEEDNDQVRACTACLDARNPPEVHCPRLNATINNRSATTAYLP